ncbi:MAG: dihydroorotase [Chitinophagaceae bacterium]
MERYVIKNASIVNEGKTISGDVLIQNGRIAKIATSITVNFRAIEIDAENQFLLPGAIDDQVHFREPGLTHKATIYTEARAAVAGGVTSFMEMPNTLPPAFTQELLEEKYEIASRSSLANYSFYMGTSNSNPDEALKTNEKRNEICGIKIFMGSSTGGLLVDDESTLEKLFRESGVLIATHCEDENIIRQNLQRLKNQQKILSAEDHPVIRDENACYESSHYAVELARKYGTRLHVLHITTAKELALFSNLIPLEQKKITAEVCVHHLHFTSEDYKVLGNLIKCNPAIKAPYNKEALWRALLDDRLDVIATDHAPHTLEEKAVDYEQAHAGLPLVQHPLMLMLHYVKKGKITVEKMVDKMSHSVATCFQVADRGFIREGYFADLVLANMDEMTNVSTQNILYKCGWSPLEGSAFPSVTHTFVNGNLVYQNGKWYESFKGMRLTFNRK